MTTNTITITMNPAAWILPGRAPREMMRARSAPRSETSASGDWALCAATRDTMYDDHTATRDALTALGQTEPLTAEVRDNVRAQIRSHLNIGDQT